MIVNDDYDITNLFKDFLECNGYVVDVYTNPIDAIFNFRKQSHDLIIFDLKLPKMDEISLCQKIKAIDEQVIICPTTADKSLIQDLQKGITDIEKAVIYNPFLLKDLIKSIQF